MNLIWIEFDIYEQKNLTFKFIWFWILKMQLKFKFIYFWILKLQFKFKFIKKFERIQNSKFKIQIQSNPTPKLALAVAKYFTSE